MAGLIGQAISNIGSTIGNYMMQSSMQEDRQEERRREREEDARRQAERDALYKRTADQQAAAAAARSSGGGGGNSREYTPEEQAVMAVESGRFGSQGDVDKFKSAVKTGDYSGYKQDVTKTRYEEGFQGAADAVQQTVKDYPPGFEQEVQAKARVLSNITRESVHGKDLANVNKGRNEGWGLEQKQGIVAGAAKPEPFAAAQASEKGKLYESTGEAGTFNVATGSSALNPLGQAKAEDEKASAAQHRANADKAKREPTGRNEDLPTLQQMRKAAEETLKDSRKALTEFDKVNTGDLSRPGREKLKEQRDALAAEVTTARDGLSKISDRLSRRLDETEAASKPGAAPKPAPAPSAGGALPEPKTPEEVAKLKPGTRFRAPDGSIRYR